MFKYILSIAKAKTTTVESTLFTKGKRQANENLFASYSWSSCILLLKGISHIWLGKNLFIVKEAILIMFTESDIRQKFSDSIRFLSRAQPL